MEKSITELLVRPQIAFETIPGHYTGETKFRTGFVIHISGVLRRQTM